MIASPASVRQEFLSPADVGLREFSPRRYLRSGHLQTVLTTLHRPKVQLPAPLCAAIPLGHRGGMYAYRNDPPANFVGTGAATRDRPAVVMLHGLGSSHSGTYMTGVADRLLRRGWTTIRLDMPGAGPSMRITDLPPSAASSPYVLTALDWVASNWGIQRFVLLGFSLGGNIALHLCGRHRDALRERAERPDGMRIERVVAVAPPIDLAWCCEAMERGIRRLYAAYFVRNLRFAAAKRAELWERWREVRGGFSESTIRGFDDAVTAPLSGYNNAAEYYADNSVHRQLNDLVAPATLLVDQHDPIVPYAMFKENPASGVRIIATRRGGHLGYYERVGRRNFGRWADEAIAELVDGSSVESADGR